MHRLALQRRGGLAAQERSGQGRRAEGRNALGPSAQGRRQQEWRAQGPVVSVPVPLRRVSWLENPGGDGGGGKQKKKQPQKKLRRATPHTTSFLHDLTPPH